MRSHRRIVLALAAFFPLATHAACSATNGDAIPSQVFDASALDVGPNPNDPQGEAGTDGSSASDAGSDASVDASDAATASAAVQINELFVDNDGLGDGAEIAELRAAPGTRADDLRLRILKADGTVKYEVLVGGAGAVFNPEGLWVVGGTQAFRLNASPYRVDQQVNINSWGLDNDRGAVQLLRGTKLLDVVGYARDPDAGAVAPPPTPPAITVEGKPAAVPDAPAGAAGSKKHRSFGRKNGAPDTNDNAADFCAMEASPGFTQKPCL
jgi:hypothetical protein